MSVGSSLLSQLRPIRSDACTYGNGARLGQRCSLMDTKPVAKCQEDVTF